MRLRRRRADVRRGAPGGEPLAAGSPSGAIDRGIATIYQELDLVEDLSVAQNVFLGHEPAAGRPARPGRDAKGDRRDPEAPGPRGDLAARVRPRPAARRPPGGVDRPRPVAPVRLLIMDEPSAILDDGEIETMFGVVRRLTAEGVGVIYISHRLDEIGRLGDRVTVLTDGRTVASGFPASTSVDELVELMVGRKVDQLYPDRAPGTDKVLLEVRGLTRLPDVRDVSFEVRAGEVLGIGGLVGAGRSELLRAVYGVDGRDAGEVLVAGEPLARAARQGDRRRPRARARGPQVPGPPDGVEPGEEREPGRPRPVPPPVAPEPARRARGDGPPAQSAQHGAGRGRARRRGALRREPAEGRPRPLAAPRVPGPPAGRADARGGRRDEGRALPRHRRAGGSAGIGVVVVSSELDELAGICTRVLVMQEGGLVAEVAGEETSELDLLRHAVTASGQAEYRDEIAREAHEHARLSIPSLGSGRLRTQEYALVGVIAVLIVVGAILEGGNFASIDNFRAILTQASVVGVVAVGMTFVIATSGIDLSVGSMLAAAGIAGGLLVDSGSAAFILGALAFGLVLGGFNGVAIAYGRVVPFIATLAMFAMARGLALLMNDKLPISLFSADGVRWFGTGEIVTIPVSILIFLLITALGWVGLNRTRYGRYVVAVGGNREAARIAGVPVQRIIFSVYCLTGLLAGLAAILLSARLASASPVSGNLLELDAIGAVVIGGTSLAGGRATIVGTFLGVIVFAIIFNLLTQLNLATEWQQIVKGVIILAAVLIQRPERI